MARPLRIEFPGAVYHITSRGNRKESIFLNDGDRTFFLSVLSEAVETHNWICHAYCLMGNHYHLMVETPDGNLSLGMRDLNGNYAQAYNQHHGTVGHLFQGRFDSFLIDKDAYLLNVARYTILNPVRAKLVNHPGEWEWSSYAATAGMVETPAYLDTNSILSHFSKDHRTAVREYQKFVGEGVWVESPFEQLKPGGILGHEMFVDWVWENVTKGSEKLQEVTKENRIVWRPTLGELFEGVSDKKHRDDLIRLAHTRCGYSLTDIARHLRMSRVGISKIFHRDDKNASVF